MKKILLVLLVLFGPISLRSQSDNCSGAPALIIGSCVTGAPGATQNLTGCGGGNANDDAWYKFTATAGGSYSITVKGSATYDAVVQLYSGTCAALVSISGCADSYANGGTESIIVSGLAAGTYYLRIYDYSASAAPGSFTTCITLPPAPPTNNECAGSKTLTVNSSCVNTSTTSFAATQSTAVATSCNGTPDDDVWFMFTANNYTQTIQVTPTGSMYMDAVIELYSGPCGSLASIACEDSSYSGEVEDLIATGLTPGNNYYIRIFDYYSDGGYPFDICVSGNPISVGTQPNDNPCTAIHLPNVTADCNYLDFSTVGATQTSTLLVPAPTNCTNWQGSATTGTAAPYYGTATTGGYGATTKDVWFSITVPASGFIYVMPRPNMGAGWISDGVMALYRGANCSALTQYTCTDDYDYPAGYNDMQPFIQATGLTPGETVYLRYFGYGSSSGNFGLCVTAPTNDACTNALYICDINGYSASTSEAYTRDHPCNMRGNAEAGATYTYNVGSSPTAPFGLGGAWGTGSATQNVYIDNNSWIKFTAASPTVSLRVTVYDCWGSGSNTLTTAPTSAKGVQMQIFSASSACCGFAPVSDFKEGTGTYTVNANSLTIGSDYYLMVDGWNGDICKYDIQAIAGVALPDIVANPPSVCPGQSTILTAPSGAISYTWEPGGANTQTISVIPGSTETYTCYVGGVCGSKQMLTKTITMKIAPTVAINTGTAITTCGTQTLTLTGSGASTYSWSTGNTSTSFTTAPSSNTSYSIIGTAANGCTNTAVSVVTVNPIPSFTITSSLTNTICFGQSTVLTATGTATSYTWSPPGTVASSITVSPTSITVYNVTGMNAEGCIRIIPTTITVNALPTVSSTSVTICNGKTGTLSIGGTASTYTWSTGVSTASISVTPSVTTTYTVIGTSAASCTNSAVGQVSVTPIPTITINSGNPITVCNTQSVTLTGGGAISYTWNTGSTSNPISVSPSSNTTYTLTGAASVTGCTNIAIATVSVNSLPNIITAGTTTICNGKSTTLTASNGVSYTWTPVGTVASSITVGPTSNTTYTVTGTGANGCINTAVTTVTVNSLPTISVNNSTICSGNMAILTSTSSALSFTWSTGSNGTSITPSPTTTTNYTVTGTAANTCTNSAIGQVSVTALPTIAVGSGTICENQSYILTANSASSYTWSTGQNGPSISVTPTTTTVYTVSGTAATTCSNSTTATITVNALPQLVATPSISPSNCGASTGSITNMSVTGSPVLSYTWTNSSAISVGNSPTLNNQSAGTYYLNVSDGNSCTSNFGPFIITNPGSQPSPTISVVASPVCAGGTIDLVSTSASSYTWTGPGGYTSNNQSPTILNANTTATGLYVLSVTYTNGCQASSSVSVTVNANPLANASASSGSVCANSTINLFGSSASTYTWSGPGSYSSNSQNPSITGVGLSASGIYTLVLTDANNCQNTATVNVTVNSNPVITASASPGIVCVGQTISLTANGGTSYSWNGPNGFSDTNQSPSIINSATVNAGEYTVTVTGANTCTTSAITTVSVNALPTFTSSVNSANICYGATIQFNAGSSGNVYSWDGPNSFSVTNNASPGIANATPSNSGTYTVTAGGGSCSASQTIAVNVYPQITLTANATSTAICEGSNLQLLGSSASTYTWTGPGSYSSNNQNPQIINASTTVTGTYSFAVTDVNNCSTTSTVDIIVNANPTATAGANPSAICDGQDINLTGGGGTTYSWSGPNGYNSSAQTATITNAGSVYTGDYTVTVTDANLCSSMAITTVTVNSLPSYTWSANASNVCYGGAIQLNASTSPFTYLWSGPNSYTASGSNATINNATTLNSGIYTITATDANCSQSQTVSVNVYSQIVMNASANGNIVCNGNTVNLLGTGGGGYSWDGPNNFSSTSQNPQIINAQANADGIYTLTVTDALTNCTEGDTVLIVIATTPTLVGITNGSTCFGGAIDLFADFGTGVSVNWYTDAALTNTVITNSNTYQPGISVDGTYVYYAQGMVGGCLSSVTTVTAQYNNINAAAFADVYSGSTPLTVNFTNNSSGVTATDYFNWTFGDNTGTSVINPNHVFNDEGNYNVVLMITDVESGCMDTTTIVIKVEDDVVIIVPNVFTPNGDGVNETFHVNIKGVKSAEGSIYNRWGQLLYSWDVINTAWDGKGSNGEICPDGTYYYLIKVIDKKDKEHLFPGYALIIR